MSWADHIRSEFHLKKRSHKHVLLGVPKWSLWIFCILMLAAYAFIFYLYVVNPVSFRWKGIFGGTSPSGYSIRGIDVSHYQGKIDWQSLKNATPDGEPISFVFVKATEGTDFLDDNFNQNIRACRLNGFICGAYHFFLPSEPAEAQAKYFLQNVKLVEGDFPPVLDIEHQGMLTKEEVKVAARTWLKIIEEHYKVKPIIYTNYKFKMQYLNDSVFDAYPYWIAHYYVDTLRYQGRWKLWQYTDNGRLEGIKGTVDFDIYNGSMYDLHKLLIGHKEENDFEEDVQNDSIKL